MVLAGSDVLHKTYCCTKFENSPGLSTIPWLLGPVFLYRSLSVLRSVREFTVDT